MMYANLKEMNNLLKHDLNKSNIEMDVIFVF